MLNQKHMPGMLKSSLFGVLLPGIAFGLILGTAGCQQKKGSTDTGKVYTADGAGKKGDSGGSGAANDESTGSSSKPLNSPAQTTDSKASQESDNGSVAATSGQINAVPGAPVPPAQSLHSKKKQPPPPQQ